MSDSLKITVAQRWKILQLWTQVCKDRRQAAGGEGWKSSDRALRLKTIGGILGRELTTLDQVGRVDECTKVMHSLNAMLGTSVQSGREAEDQTINKARTYRNVIRRRILPCLALYVDDANAFMQTVMEEKNRWWQVDRPAVGMTLDDLDAKPIVRTLNGEVKESASTLEQLLMTLNARLHAKRKAARHTIHEMNQLAGLKCKPGCAMCRPMVTIQGANPAGVMVPAEVDENPF